MKLDQDEIVKLLKNKKIKLTPNRIKIACELFNSDDHPSIEEIHQRLLKNGERISFTSIYNIVKLFESTGLVKEIKVGNKSHYDPNVIPHIHFIGLGYRLQEGISIIRGIREMQRICTWVNT